MNNLEKLETLCAGTGLDIKLVIPVGVVPDRATVSKRRGEKTYTLLREMRVYGSTNGSKTNQRPHGNKVWLATETSLGTLIEMDENEEVVWHVTGAELRKLKDMMRRKEG